jgi:hypothetical protein
VNLSATSVLTAGGTVTVLAGVSLTELATLSVAGLRTVLAAVAMSNGSTLLANLVPLVTPASRVVVVPGESRVVTVFDARAVVVPAESRVIT